ncbi:bis(5'-nucleosyl)-tetraphosphatase [Chlamydiifrater phoenicopteri]|uniref:bis(5'-nucleosyl)-tetraphosphatase n=1 Tax=Chlamydiifrater phoenicopteri TaxID=2681469 RepID=UPI001BCE8157|nr:NUDIX domain-containing protein [Chlamydiifrater phoenicopteri]
METVKKDYSFGIIPIKYLEGRASRNIKVCLIRHAKGGHWGFPKGHSEENEGPQFAAERELVEETGLGIVSFFPKVLKEHYEFSQGGQTISKEVTYFIAEVSGEVRADPEEISDYNWVSLGEASKILSFPEALNTLKEAKAFLDSIPARE